MLVMLLVVFSKSPVHLGVWSGPGGGAPGVPVGRRAGGQPARACGTCITFNHAQSGQCFNNLRMRPSYPCRWGRACCRSQTCDGPYPPARHSPLGRPCPGGGLHGHVLGGHVDRGVHSVVHGDVHGDWDGPCAHLSVEARPGPGPGAVLAGRGGRAHPG